MTAGRGLPSLLQRPFCRMQGVRNADRVHAMVPLSSYQVLHPPGLHGPGKHRLGWVGCWADTDPRPSRAFELSSKDSIYFNKHAIGCNWCHLTIGKTDFFGKCPAIA